MPQRFTYAVLVWYTGQDSPHCVGCRATEQEALELAGKMATSQFIARTAIYKVL